MIKSLIMRFAGAALISSAALKLAPKGGAKRAVSLACGLLSVITVLSVVIKPDSDSLAQYMELYRERAEGIVENAVISDTPDTRFIIESRLEEYILDKAALDGLTVDITASWSDKGFWYPTKAALGGNLTEEERDRVERLVEEELGIPKEGQIWTG